MTKQQEEQNPSTIVDKALHECTEEVKGGFKDFEYAEDDLDDLRTSLRPDFEELLDHDKGDVTWRADRRRALVAAYELGRAAHGVALLDDRETIETSDIKAALAFVAEHCTLGAARRAYCDHAKVNWPE